MRFDAFIIGKIYRYDWELGKDESRYSYIVPVEKIKSKFYMDGEIKFLYIKHRGEFILDKQRVNTLLALQRIYETTEKELKREGIKLKEILDIIMVNIL